MFRGVVFSCLGALAAVVLAWSPPGRDLERRVGLGLLYAARGPLEAPDGALVVGLDRASIGWLQRNAASLGDCLSPEAVGALARARNVNQLPRALYACLLERLAAQHPRLVVFDINFNAETPDDALLAGAVAAAGNVLLLERIERGEVLRRLAPAAVLARAARGTFFFQTDGNTREVATGYPTRDPSFPDLASLPATASVLGGSGPAPAQPAFQPIWLYGPADTVPGLTLRQVLAGSAAGGVTGATVFVGSADAADRSAYDHFRVPLLGADEEIVSGVELAATAYLNLVHDQRLRVLPPAAWAGVVFGHAFLTLLAARRLGGWRSPAVVALIACAWGAVAAALFTIGRIWAPVAVPLIVVTPLALVVAFAARFAVAQRLVERLAPRPFARELLARPGVGRGRTIVEDATIMFADIVGSTGLAERLGEAAFWTMMNDYYATTASAIEANGGVVVEYMGDGILALFTAAVAGPDHARRACRAAQAISQASRRRGADAPDYRLRFGIHSGTVMTGSAGAESRFSYKAIGESVILAARLEEHGRTLPQDGSDLILVSDDTRRRAGLPDRALRALGSTAIRGLSNNVEIFLLLPYKV